MSKLEQHSAVMALNSGIIYLAMFMCYVAFDFSWGLFDVIFLAVLIVLIISIVAYTIMFSVRIVNEEDTVNG